MADQEGPDFATAQRAEEPLAKYIERRLHRAIANGRPLSLSWETSSQVLTELQKVARLQLELSRLTGGIP